MFDAWLVNLFFFLFFFFFFAGLRVGCELSRLNGGELGVAWEPGSRRRVVLSERERVCVCVCVRIILCAYAHIQNVQYIYIYVVMYIVLFMYNVRACVARWTRDASKQKS